VGLERLWRSELYQRALDSPERAGPSMLPASRRLPQKLQIDLLTWLRLRPPLQACFDQLAQQLGAIDSLRYCAFVERGNHFRWQAHGYQGIKTGGWPTAAALFLYFRY
jgi:hypothetical protein